MPRVSTSFGQQGSAFLYETMLGPIIRGSLFSSTAEPVLIDSTTVAGSAPTVTVNFDVSSQSVVFLSSNAGANWTMNFRGAAATPLNSFMNVGQSITVALLATQGVTAYYNNAVQVDGNSITPKWQGGTAPTAGNSSSVDIYVYTIVKTENATFTIYAAQTKFA